MGLAKYFEDIEKIRDQAAALSGSHFKISAAEKHPEWAKDELLRLQEKVAKWSSDIVKKLDDILELATDPAIDRQLVIERQNIEISQLKSEVSRNFSDIAKLAKQRDEARAALSSAMNALSEEKETNRQLVASLQTTKDNIRRTKLEVTALQSELSKLKERAREAVEFKNLMQTQGVRSLKNGSSR